MRLDAKFVTSAFAPEGYPRWDRVEVALAGRSNVGKSSMLNALAGSKNLARTSRTPGRTRALNFFAVGDRLAIIDLPGYGFAKMVRTEAARIASMMNDYLGQSERLAGLVLLPSMKSMVSFGLLILVLLLRPQGLLGRRA